MRDTLLKILVVGLLGLGPGLCGFGGAGASGEALAGDALDGVGLDDLAWLAGSWSGEIQGAGATTRFEAHYTSPQGGVILSTSKAFRPGGELAWFEFERFEVRDGRLQVTPYPGGRVSVSFTLAEYDPAARKAVFTNPQHDYPTRIVYHRVAEDRLLLTVAGDSEQAPVMEFSLAPLE